MLEFLENKDDDASWANLFPKMIQLNSFVYKCNEMNLLLLGDELNLIKT